MLTLAAFVLSVYAQGGHAPPARSSHRTVLLEARAPDGAAAGADVWLARGSGGMEPSGVTDSEGRATVLVPVRPAYEGQDFRLVVAGHGSLGAVLQRTLPLDDVPLALTVDLVPFAVVPVTTDPPCSDCEVELLYVGLGEVRLEPDPRLGIETPAKTDSAGRTTLRVPVDAEVAVVCRSAGFEHGWNGRGGDPVVIPFDCDGRIARGEPALSSSALIIELLATDPALTHGRAVTVRPVSMDEVSSGGVRHRGSDPDRPTPRRSEHVTGADGRLALPSFPDLAVRVEVSRSPEDPPFLVEQDQAGIVDPATGARVVQLRLVTGPVAEGRVLSAGGLTPIPGVELVLRDGSLVQRVISDGEGRYRYATEAGRRLTLEIARVPVGWRMPHQWYTSSAFEIDPDPARGFVLELARPAPLEVRVTDRAGAGIEGARVRLRSGNTVHGGRSGANGVAVLPDGALRPEGLEVRALGYAPLTVESVRGTSVEVVLEAAEPEPYEVIVFDAELAPVADFELELAEFDWTVARARTDPHGRAVLSVPAGTEYLSLAFAAPELNARRSVHLQPGEDLVFVPVSRNVPLRGRVVDGAGRPIVGARVVHGRQSCAVTDEEGSFELRDTRAELPLVVASAEGYGQACAVGLGPDGSLLVRLGALDEIEGAGPLPRAGAVGDSLDAARRLALARALVERLPDEHAWLATAELRRLWRGALEAPAPAGPVAAQPGSTPDADLESDPYWGGAAPAAPRSFGQVPRWIARTDLRGPALGAALRPFLVPPRSDRSGWNVGSGWNYDTHGMAFHALAAVDRGVARGLACEVLAWCLEEWDGLADMRSEGLALLFAGLDEPVARALARANRSSTVAKLRNRQLVSHTELAVLYLFDGEVFSSELAPPVQGRPDFEPRTLLAALAVLTAPREALLEASPASVGFDPELAALHGYGPRTIDPALFQVGGAR